MEKLDEKSLEILRYLVSNKEQNSTILATMVTTHYSNTNRELVAIIRSLRAKGLINSTIDDEREIVKILEVTHEGSVYEKTYLEETESEFKKSHQQKIWQIKTIIFSATVSMVFAVITAFFTTLITNHLLLI